LGLLYTIHTLYTCSTNAQFATYAGGTAWKLCGLPTRLNDCVRLRVREADCSLQVAYARQGGRM